MKTYIVQTFRRLAEAAKDKFQLALLVLAFLYISEKFRIFRKLIQKHGFLNLIQIVVLRGALAVPGVAGKALQEQRHLVKQAVDSIRFEDEPDMIMRVMPSKPQPINKVLKYLQRLKTEYQEGFNKGKCLGGIYKSVDDVDRALTKAYDIFCHTNMAYHSIFPAVRKFEAEIISMVNSIVNGPVPHAGVLSSGGTESILLAIMAYRNYYRKKGIINPNIVMSITAHCAFTKGCEMFDVEARLVPVDRGYAAPEAFEKLMDSNTICIVASAPSWPHGVMDNVPALAKLALKKKTGLHVDNCLGAFITPFLAKNGFMPFAYDFRVEGVSSMSCDVHKFGGAHKGCSIILYRDPEVRRCQFYSTGTWPGGLMVNPTFQNSRNGGIIAQAWASLVMRGSDAMEADSMKVHKAWLRLKKCIDDNPHLELWGEATCCNLSWISTNPKIEIFKLADALEERGKWDIYCLLQDPMAIMFAMGCRQAELVEQLCEDIDAACEMVLEDPSRFNKKSPTYGMAAQMPDGDLVGGLMVLYQEAVLSMPLDE